MLTNGCANYFTIQIFYTYFTILWVTAMVSLQEPNGSFRASVGGNESDTRFLYCACAVSTILNDWSGVDIPNAVQFILSCVTYEGAISLHPGLLEYSYFPVHNFTLAETNESKLLFSRTRRPWRVHLLRSCSAGADESDGSLE